MATSENTPVQPKEHPHIAIKEKGEAYRDGWGWVLIPLLKLVITLVLIGVAVFLKKYLQLDYPTIIGFFTAAKAAASKIIPNLAE